MHYAELKQVCAALTSPGTPFEMETTEVQGIPMRIFKNAPKNLRDIWSATSAFSDQDYIVYENERISYAQAHVISERISVWLLSQGVKSGDRVAIAMRNYPEWLLIFWACVSNGIAVVGINSWWVAGEIETALEQTQPKVLFADKERLALISEERFKEFSAVVAVRSQSDDLPSATLWEDVLSCKGDLQQSEIDPDATACLYYTSGTSGNPKAAEITHRSAVTNIFNIIFAKQTQIRASELANNIEEPAPAEVSTVLLATPLFHVTANNCAAQVVTAIGGKLVLMYRWDASKALHLIEQERITGITGVPVMARELINHKDFSCVDTSSLTTISSGGAPVESDLLEKIERAGGEVHPSLGYGMTEVSGVIATNSGDFLADKPASCGPLMPTFEMKVIDDDDQILPAGSVGEICVRGSAVIKGYFNEPEATADTIKDGWLYTGDLGYIDEDEFIYIVDRKKEMVLRGGENVFCSEVEGVLYKHSAVAECSVFAVPDERLGETVGAALYLKSNQELTEEDLKDFCSEHLAKYKIPENVWFLEKPLPRNASGKFLKKEIINSLGI